MSHKCNARQCDSIGCNRTTSDRLDNRFPRIREGHPATAPPSHQALRIAPVLPGLLRPFPSVAVWYHPAFPPFCSEGAHALSDFKDSVKRQEMLVGHLAVLWCRTVEQSFIHFCLVEIAAFHGRCWVRGLGWTQPGPQSWFLDRIRIYSY